MSVVRVAFKPEFLNRLDDIVFFHALDTEQLGADRRHPDPGAGAAARRPAADARGHPGGQGVARDRRLRPAVRCAPAAPADPVGDRRPAGQGAAGRPDPGRRHRRGRRERRRPRRAGRPAGLGGRDGLSRRRGSAVPRCARSGPGRAPLGRRPAAVRGDEGQRRLGGRLRAAGLGRACCSRARRRRVSAAPTPRSAPRARRGARSWRRSAARRRARRGPTARRRSPPGCPPCRWTRTGPPAAPPPRCPPGG